MKQVSKKLLAKQILDNKLFNDIVLEYEKKMFEEWKTSKDPVERDGIFIKVEALTGLVDEIKENLMRIKDE